MSRTIDVSVATLLRVRELHERIDDSATRIAAALGERLRCARGCAACCVDDIEVSPAEAARIVDAFPAVIGSAPADPGSCAMLDASGACRVYAARPYVCRTQGLPLRWLERDDAGEIVERRDICPLNDPPATRGQSASLEELPEDACWTVGRAEQALTAIDRIAAAEALAATSDPGSVRVHGARVRLRDLFAALALDEQQNPSE